ncbi:Oxidoreductase short-chain dehydrogenase/reductase family [Penicillium taxi]|uniref:Oxidoreductase short-chain dehydrogenase/reductase family n=1 Tax=Penicillium taxi TaxID=168475 RepID=UPI002544E716|nr:Oxidoreductase short-chain dehydrogenase/reductase family [Penicillium taxi]KAJ5884752.1 Oxidoreductase short-chain dehydrogenase/reductase family [Penicillium taxi]
MTFLECNLASLASMKQAAETFIRLSEDDYEIQFGTNHLGHALLICKLLPLIQATAANADVRIILVTSLGFKFARGIAFATFCTHQEAIMGKWLRYGQRKLASLLYARELARHYSDLMSISLTPRVVNTGLVGNLSRFSRAFVWVTNLSQVLKPEEGVYNHIWVANIPKDCLQNGKFYEPAGVLSSNLGKAAKDEALAKQLWKSTDEALELHM